MPTQHDIIGQFKMNHPRIIVFCCRIILYKLGFVLKHPWSHFTKHLSSKCQNWFLGCIWYRMLALNSVNINFSASYCRSLLLTRMNLTSFPIACCTSFRTARTCTGHWPSSGSKSNRLPEQQPCWLMVIQNTWRQWAALSQSPQTILTFSSWAGLRLPASDQDIQEWFAKRFLPYQNLPALSLNRLCMPVLFIK